MKLTITKENLAGGLEAVKNVVGSHTTLPILSTVLLSAEKDRLELTTTDLDVTISTKVEAEIKKPGAITIPARKIFAVVKELVGSDIEIEAEDSCAIRCGSNFFKLHGLDADEFPKPKGFKESGHFLVPQSELKAMLHRTLFAVSEDESRFVLNGLYIVLENERLTVVATDGRRLAKVESELPARSNHKAEFIVPAKTAKELHRLLRDEGGVEVRHAGAQISFDLGHAFIVSKLIEGNYPNYKQVIPDNAKERIGLIREEFIHAVRCAEIVSNGSSHVKLALSKNCLTVSARSPEVGEARENMAVNYKGSAMSIGFNARYLIEPLNAIDSDEVFLELTDDVSAGVIKCRENFMCVIMPVRTS